MKGLVFPDKITHEADKQDILKDNDFSGCHSQQCTIKRLGSVRVRPLPSAHENNDVIVSNDYYQAVA